MPVNATERSFNSEVSQGVVLADFWAAWCGPCRMLSPTLDRLEEENDQLKVVKVNVDEQSRIARNFGILSIPTMILFKDGEAVKTLIGVKPKNQLEKELEGYL